MFALDLYVTALMNYELERARELYEILSDEIKEIADEIRNNPQTIRFTESNILW
jgi:phytoene/squalene synthetase